MGRFIANAFLLIAGLLVLGGILVVAYIAIVGGAGLAMNAATSGANGLANLTDPVARAKAAGAAKVEQNHVDNAVKVIDVDTKGKMALDNARTANKIEGQQADIEAQCKAIRPDCSVEDKGNDLDSLSSFGRTKPATSAGSALTEAWLANNLGGDTKDWSVVGNVATYNVSRKAGVKALDVTLPPGFTAVDENNKPVTNGQKLKGSFAIVTKA